ncbi:MAG: hypothetical protein ACLT98_07800 [Eggerthellaceae bacterium]
MGLVKGALALDPALDRFYRGILLLICDYSSDYTVESSPAPFTNKQQAQEDIRAWNDMLYPYGARIERGHRLTVVGPEEHIRFFVTHSLFGSPHRHEATRRPQPSARPAVPLRRDRGRGTHPRLPSPITPVTNWPSTCRS